MTTFSLPVRPSGRRLAGDAPAALPSLPLRAGGGGKLDFCGWREGTEGGREDLGFSPVLRPAVSDQCGVGGGLGDKGEQLPGKVTPCKVTPPPQGSKGLGERFELSMWILGVSELCPGALGCLAPAAPFTEPPGEGSLYGDILLSDISRCSCETCTEVFFNSAKSSALAC